MESFNEHCFDLIFQRVITSKKIPSDPDSAEYLRRLCLREGRTELRACYPTDILNIVQSISLYENRPVQMNKSDMERAAALYFARS